jgi:hypothetical protein
MLQDGGVWSFAVEMEEEGGKFGGGRKGRGNLDKMGGAKGVHESNEINHFFVQLDWSCCETS